MKKLYFFLSLLLSTHAFSQQIPKVIVEDAQDLQLTHLGVTVDIVGNLAVTTYYMKFYNALGRTLEGTLVFPLAEGQSVSGFSMDVNGKMREAVIVEKELGRVAYETTIRRQIDPGLLEKTQGNNYKARIYPILPNGHKYVMLKFEQELSTLDGKQSYELPLGITEKLTNFSVEMNVYSATLPIVYKTSYKDFFFKKNGKMYTATTSKTLHAPEQPIIIQIPNKTNQEQLSTYEGYFNFYKALQPTMRLKKKPENITILWDASYSMSYKDVENELKVLQSYLEYVRNVQVDFIAFNNAIQTRKTFTITDGDLTGLLEEIKNVHYDGGTKLNVLEDVKIKADELLLFSDGLANLGDFAIKRKIPIYAINSLISANHQNLTDITTQSGGNYLNLLRVDFAKAAQLLKMETYQFLGVIHDDIAREIYPRKRVNVFQDFSISGQFSKDTQIELLFGYGGRVTQKIPVTIEASEGTKAVKRLWAKQKLAHLNQDKIANEKAITALATKYGLITDYTSMIILDRIEDYARYKIKPPKELLAAYKEQLVFEKEAEKYREQRIQERRNDLLDSYEELWDWYQTELVASEEKKQEVSKGTNVRAATITRSRRRRTVVSQNLGPLETITGSIIDEYGYPIPYVSVSVDRLANGNSVLTDATGYYSIQAKMGQELVFTYVGYNTEKIKITKSNINLRMKSGEQLEEVVVVGYGGVIESAKLAYAVSSVSSSSIQQFSSPSDEIRKKREAIEMLIEASTSLTEDRKPLVFINGTKSDVRSFRKIEEKDIYNLGILKNQEAMALYGSKARGGLVYVITKKGMIENRAAIDAFEEKMTSSIRLKAWNSNMPYIKELGKETSIANAYKKYIKLRDDYATIPTFYIDVADFFHSRQATATAITILTNLLEIELDNYELLKMTAYKLEYFEQYEMAVLAYEKVLELRPEEPQSYRDLALAYEYVGDIQKSYDLLHKIYNGELVLKDENGRFTGIENIAYIELTRLVNTYPKQLKLKRKKRKAFKEMPLDVRIVIDWNHNDTDIDLWVVDPKGEKAFYNNNRTKIGGRISDDLTEGYGVLQKT